MLKLSTLAYVILFESREIKQSKRCLSVSANDELEIKQSKWTAVVNKLRTYSEKLKPPQNLKMTGLCKE